jgi:O-antigen/teichoic acid export membrane protein
LSLTSTAVSGSKWKSISVIFKASIQFVQMILLANILAPEDYGLIGMMSFFIGLSSVLVDMGIGASIIHAKEISRNQLSSLYWLNVFVGFILLIAISLLSPVVAKFYSEPKIKELIIFMALGLFANSFTFQHQFLLLKDLKFKENSIYEVVYQSVLLLSSYSMAINGFGVYSLIIPNIIVSILAAIFLIYFQRKKYLPQFYFSFSGIKRFLSFSLYQTSSNLLSYFNSQIDMLLIGFMIGAEKFGYYYMAKNLAMRPMQIISPIIISVAAPLMAKINEDVSRLKIAYSKVINYISLVLFPVYFILIIFTDEFISLLYGEKWINSAFPLKILSIIFVVRGIISPIGSLMQATGKAKEALWYNLLLFILFPIFIYGGSFFGVEGILYSQIIIVLLFFFIHIKMIINPLVNGITILEFFNYFGLNALINVALLVLCFILKLLIPNQFVWFFTALSSFSVLWLVLNFKFNQSFKELLVHYKILK